MLVAEAAIPLTTVPVVEPNRPPNPKKRKEVLECMALN